MALTIGEAAKLSRSMLVRGVVETLVTESSVLRVLPFMTVTGSSLTYNQEATLGNADFYAVGDSWAESTATFNKLTANLTVLGGDADVDNFLQRTYSDTNDLRATVLQKKAKATAYAFNTAFFSGDSSVNPKSFDGLAKLVPNAQKVDGGGGFNLDKLDEMLDKIKPGRPEVMFMSRATRRLLLKQLRTAGNLLETSRDAYGQPVYSYGGVAVYLDDNLDDDNIYALKLGMDGVMGLQNGSISVTDLGQLETKNALRARIAWYCGVALFSTVGAANLTHIS